MNDPLIVLFKNKYKDSIKDKKTKKVVIIETPEPRTLPKRIPLKNPNKGSITIIKNIFIFY
jgi:hypothetical protein